MKKEPAKWVELAAKLVSPLEKLGSAIAEAVRRGRARRRDRRAARSRDSR